MSNNNYSRIEDYLTGRLSAAEKEAFEKESDQDQELSAELALHRLEHRAMKLAVHDDLRAKMADWRQDSTETEETEAKVVPMAGRRRLRSVLSIAASALLLLAVGGSWWANQTYGDNALAMEFSAAPSLTQRSGDIADDPISQADLALKANDPQRAIDLLAGQSDPTALLLLGNAQLAQGNFDTAAASYQQVLNNGSQAQAELAEWQLTLTAIANGQADAARSQLDAIISQQPAHTYRNKAQALQEQLNSGWRKLVW